MPLRAIPNRKCFTPHQYPCSTRGFRRALFSLSNFPSLDALSRIDGNAEQTFQQRKTFQYTRRQLFEIVADVASYPRFIPFCTGSRILSSAQQTPPAKDIFSKTIMDAELTVGFMSFNESYISKVVCEPYESVTAVASSSTPLFKTLTTTWRFQPDSEVAPHSDRGIIGLHRSHLKSDLDQGPTCVIFDLSYAFANPLYAAVSAAFFGQVSQLMVKAFEERCAEVYGSAA